MEIFCSCVLGLFIVFFFNRYVDFFRIEIHGTCVTFSLDLYFPSVFIYVLLDSLRVLMIL